MGNNKIDALFGVFIVALIVSSIILIRDFDTTMANQTKDYSLTIDRIVRAKNVVIKSLFNQLTVKEKECEDLKNTLSDTRNALEGLSKKLVGPMPVTADGASAPTGMTK